MRTMKRVLLAAAAASLMVASHGATAAASASAPAPVQSAPVQSAPVRSTSAAGPGWHHVADFPPGEESQCHERGRWYMENGVRAYECRPAGVWELWVLTEPS